MKPYLCVFAVAAAASTALAGTVTTFDDSLDAGVVIGSGIGNTNFVVNTNAVMGIQTGIKALERFIGDLPNSGNTYFAQPGESPTSGAAGAPADPGTTTWNYFYSVDLGSSGLTFGDVAVLVSIDFDPVVGNSNFFTFDLAPLLGAGDTLVQDSQNIGFGFWQTLGDPNIFAINPFAPGEYTMSVEVLRLSDGALLSGVDMAVQVVPTPVAASMGLVGLGVIGAHRRRR